MNEYKIVLIGIISPHMALENTKPKRMCVCFIFFKDHINISPKGDRWNVLFFFNSIGFLRLSQEFYEFL